MADEEKLEDAVEDAVEEALKKKRESFWHKMVVVTIPVLIPAIVSAGGISAVFNWGNVAKAEAAAEEAAGDKAKAEAAKVEKAIANYIMKEIEPKITEAFEAMDSDIEGIDEDLAKCQADLRETTIIADTALRLAERSFGRRTVERTMNNVDRDEPAPKARKPRAKKPPPKFKDYQQQIADPLMATGD